MQNVSIKYKILFSFSVVVLLILAAGAIIFSVSSEVEQNARKTKNESIVFVILALKMEKDVVQVQQWLTDISATRAQDGLDDGFIEAEKSYSAFLEGLGKFESLYKARNATKKLAVVNKLRNRFEGYYQTGKEMAQAYIDGGPPLGNKLMGDFDAESEALAEVLIPFIDENKNQAISAMNSLENMAKSLKSNVTIVFSCVLAVLIFSGIFLVRTITVPIGKAVEVARKLSEGELSMEIEVNSSDETGQLLLGMRTATDNIKELLKSVKSVVQILGSSSQELSSSTLQMSDGMNQQADKATLIASSANELSATSSDVLGNAKEILDSANETSKIAKAGNAIVKKSIDEVNLIASTVEDFSEVITNLGERSRQIGEISEVISEIADQTNLLSLNAAIEAARAAEHGRGFAVVADEVRKLAERTANATSQIETMIKTVQEGVGKAVKSVNLTLASVKQGVKYSNETGEVFKEITVSIEGLNLKVSGISGAMEEMTTVSQEISRDIDTVASISRDTSQSSSKITDSTSELVRLVDDLRGAMSKFRI